MKKKMMQLIREMGCVVEFDSDGFAIECKQGYMFDCIGVHELCYYKADVQKIIELYKLAIEDLQEGVSMCNDKHCEWCER